MKARTLVIVNPASGGGSAARAEPQVASYLAMRGVAADFVRSVSAEDVREKAGRGAADGYAYVAALGGDGTFHYVIEGTFQAQQATGEAVAAGFFPAGNGNDIAEALGIAKDPVRAAEQFCDGVVKEVDLVRVTLSDKSVAHFIGVGGMGLDAEAAYLANTRYAKLPGFLRYLAGTFRVFFRQGAMDMGLQIDEQVLKGRGLFVAVANGTSYGAGARIAPDAKMNDGWLDVVVVGEVKLLRLLDALPRLFTSGDLRRFPEVQRFRGKTVKLTSVPSARVHGDGEDLGMSPAGFEVLPGVVRVVVPRG